MSASPVDVSQLPGKEKLFTFGTLVTRLDEYHEMVQSAKQAGFDRDDVEFLYIDNSQTNKYDGFTGANRFIDIAKGKYLIYCHQDILFEFDRFEGLMTIISELDQFDPDWAIFGNAGKKESGRSVVRITDPGESDLSSGNFPEKVMTIDENFMVIKLSTNISCTNKVRGFHLYGTDLCYNAYQLGYTAYVVNFHLRHKSAGNPDASYKEVENQLLYRYSLRKKSVVIQSMCSRFFVSSSSALNKAINQKSILNLHKSIKKKIYN